MVRHGSVRRYPRVARVNEVVRETIADELERLSDPRLGLVTVTGVEVSPDLRHATVYYSALDSTDARVLRDTEVDVAQAEERQEQTRAALKSAAPHIRAALGRQVRLKYIPEIVFREDPAIAQGERVEAIIRELHRHDTGLGDAGRSGPA
ncbi:MAG TPA: 30S ribosome-binding factor RbfA [Acidimicrobiia bacterium]|jgi:ribosome-binding factor A